MPPVPHAVTLPANLPPMSQGLVALALVLATWDTRRRTRASLLRLDGHLLADIGLDPDRAAFETAKAFWRD